MQTSNSTILDKKYSKLVLQISLSEVSFCIVDTLNNHIEIFSKHPIDKSLQLNEIEKSIVSFIKNTTVLQNNFDDIIVLYNNNLNTFVPQVLFDENYLSSYLQYTIKVFENDFITYDEIPNYEMNNVYIPYANINNTLIDIFGNFTYRHAASILVKKILDVSKNIEEPQVFVHCQKNTFQIIAVKNQQLLLYNSFEYKTKEDFIYYLLFCTEQLQLNPETFSLKFLGNISKEDDIYQITYKYIRNVSLYADYNEIERKFSPNDYLQNFILIHGCE